MLADLHTHTTASDGGLDPKELIKRAKKYSLDMLSITDHDTLSAYENLSNYSSANITLVPGIEFSTQWRSQEIHVIGLNIDLFSSVLKEGVIIQQQYRVERAERIADKLVSLGIDDPLPRVREIASNKNIGRLHFAQHLIETGHVRDFNQAFDKYLRKGKPAYYKQCWSALAEIIEWIKSAGGTSILTHPAKYKLTRTKLLELVSDFCDAGGHGLEVVTGKQTAEIIGNLASLCEQRNLLASCGSDFHTPDLSWSELGQFPRLPELCIPVWESW